MDKKQRTIDGLVVRDTQVRRSVGFSDVKKVRTANALGVTGVEIDVHKGVSRKQPVKVRELGEAPQRRTMVKRQEVGSAAPKEAIESFLNEVKDEDPTNLVSNNDIKKKKAKKPKRKRHVARWVIIGVLALIVGLGIWKGAEIWSALNGALASMTGGRFGLGDVIGADPTVPLKQDENGRTNILIIGTSGYDMDDDARGGDQLADTIMVVSLNQEEGDIKTFSIPRDLYVRERCTSTGRINETYWCEYQKHTRDERYGGVKNNPEGLAKLRWEYEERAMEKFMGVVGEITGQEMHYWAHANWETMITVVDALGGIELTIQYQGTEYTGDLPVIWTSDKRGIQDRNWDWACKNTCYYVRYENGTDVHLDGVHAIALARARGQAGPAYGTAGSNYAREQNQQAILDAIMRRAKQTNFVTDLNAALDIIRALGDNLRMSFNAEAIRRGIYLAGEMDVGSMQRIDMRSLFRSTAMVGGQPCTIGEDEGCASLEIPKAGTFNYSDIRAFIAKSLMRDPVEEEEAVVDVLNATGATGVAARVAQEMRGEGFKIGVVANVPEEAKGGKTMIYKVGAEAKPATEKKLLERFGVAKVSSGALPAGVESTANFVVVLGE